MPQTPSNSGEIPGLAPTPQVVALIEAAKTADTARGARAYSKDLTRLIVVRKAGIWYRAAFSKRLAAADLAARNRQHKWVSEGEVAQAFNELMTGAGGTLRTDASVVHQLRISLANTSADLGSVRSHAGECLPSEAVLLIYVLLVNNGAVSTPLPAPLPASPSPNVGYVTFSGPSGPDARIRVSRYAAVHTRSQVVELYENLAQRIGI
ncbi:MAG TPA: hypothetical protein VFU55_07600 [Terracidiphilus sp.]|nr:hypothetical protein [Terracidiphilus sp.]